MCTDNITGLEPTGIADARGRYGRSSDDSSQVTVFPVHQWQEGDPISVRGGIKDRERGRAVVEGLRAMASAQPPEEGGFFFRSSDVERARTSILGNLEGFSHCMKNASYQELEHKNHGLSYRPMSHVPCGEPGHEECAWWDAKRDLNKWKPSFQACYPHSGELKVVEFTSSLGLRAIRAVVTKVKKRKCSGLLAGTMGLLMPSERGYAYRVIVNADELDLLTPLAVAWRELAGDGAGVVAHDVEPDCSAFELAGELVCRSRQALPLLVHNGQITAWQALLWRAEELESRGKHLVFGPGFREAGIRIADAAPFSSQYHENLDKRRAEALASFSDIAEGVISENAGPESGSAERRSACHVLPQWGPCSVCHDPTCGERPTGRIVPWRAVARLLREGKAVEMPDGTVVLVVQDTLKRAAA